MSLSRLFYIAVIGGCSGYIALQLLASRAPASFLAKAVNSLGFLYGGLLFTSGLFAILATSQAIRANPISDRRSRNLWIVALPLVIGLLGVLHGYLGLSLYYKDLPSELAVPHSTVWATALVGAFFTFVSAAILLVGRRLHHDPSPLTR